MEKEFQAMEEGKAGDEVVLDSQEMKFGDKAIRRGFIRKVYVILSMQLTVTVAAIAFFVFYIPTHFCTHEENMELADRLNIHLHNTTHDNIENKLCTMRFNMQYQWILYVGMAASFILIIPMACIRSLRLSFPINFLLLASFTVAEGVTLGMVSMRYDAEAVLLAAGLTTAIVFTLTIFAFQTKIDFTMMGGMLLCVLVVFCLFSLIAIFIPQSRTLHMVMGAVGALIFSVYLVYDTQMMMGGDHKYSISPEEYIFAALAIYLDVVNIFMYILRFVGAARSS